MKSLFCAVLVVSCCNAYAATLEKITAGTAINAWVQGKIETSDNVMDTAITGNGFFPLESSDGKIFYTRALSLRLDLNQNLVQKSSDYKILSTTVDGKMVSINLKGKGTKPFEKQKDRMADLIGFNITDTGLLEGLYSDGTSVSLAQLKLAIFQNQRKLHLANKAKHLLTSNAFTGEVAYVNPATNGAGLLYPRGREKIDSSYYQENLD